MARVAHYIRVSTEEQGKFGYSVREQLHTLKAHSKSHDDEVVEESADEGFSGASLERSGKAPKRTSGSRSSASRRGCPTTSTP